MLDDFAVFIISHGRPNDVITIKTLRHQGYKDRVYILVDNHDSCIPKYRENYGDDVIVFDKDKYASLVDHGDNFNNLRTTTHARNAVYDCAKDLGITYFLVLDDDYTEFKFRINGVGSYPSGAFLARTTLTKVLSKTLEFYKVSGAHSLCFSQGGDWFGGGANSMACGYKLKRKAMNSFFCSTDRRVWFVSRLNEDVNTYLSLGQTGNLFLTTPLFSLDQSQTQATSGGMTEAYLDSGTYVKSFYTVMYCPSFAKVSLMGRNEKRIHHNINWNNAVPKILSEGYKK